MITVTAENGGPDTQPRVVCNKLTQDVSLVVVRTTYRTGCIWRQATT